MSFVTICSDNNKMTSRLWGFGDFFFDPDPNQNSDGDFLSENKQKNSVIGQIFAYKKFTFVCEENFFCRFWILSEFNLELNSKKTFSLEFFSEMNI